MSLAKDMHHYGHSLIVCQQEQCTRLYSEEELPAEFKLYLPVQQKGGHQVKNFAASCGIVLQGRGEGAAAQGGVAPPTMQ